jgi:hypothetical protein
MARHAIRVRKMWESTAFGPLAVGKKFDQLASQMVMSSDDLARESR